MSVLLNGCLSFPCLAVGVPVRVRVLSSRSPARRPDHRTWPRQLLAQKTPGSSEGVIAAAMDDYRSAFAVAQSHPWSRVPRPQPPGDVRLAPCAEIGIGLTGAGLLFMLLGMMMFFDKGLLAMGNVRRVLSGPRLHIAATVLTVTPLHLQILFLSGVMMIIGINKTFRFFFQKRKLKGGSAPRPSGPTHASPLLRLAPAPHFLPPRTCLPPYRHGVLLGRHRAGAARLASHRHGRRGLRLPQPIRVHRARSDFLSIALG